MAMSCMISGAASMGAGWLILLLSIYYCSSQILLAAELRCRHSHSAFFPGWLLIT